MTGFSADWLALREPLDAESRSGTLVRRLQASVTGGKRRILDLATGTGANLRYLAPRLGGDQDWLLVDNDGALLEAVEERLRRWAQKRGLGCHREGKAFILRGPSLRCRVYRQRMNLARDAQELHLQGRWLVTASAFLDLVACPWLEALLARCRAVNARLLFALTYDGLFSFTPPLVEDSKINELLNLHQTRDKGFGPALGPRAALDASDLCRQSGYQVAEAETPWRMGPAEAALQTTLVEGWAKAAVEVDSTRVALVESWRRRRHAHIAEGESRLRVGHRDLLAWPDEPNPANRNTALYGMAGS